MQALTQGGGPAGGPGGPPGAGGPPPSIQIGGNGPEGSQGDTGQDGKTTEDWLDQAKTALQKAEAGEQDHIESAQILNLIAKIQDILAKRQGGAESALGVTPAHKAMARAGYSSQ
jgi:hypothetical protein